MMHTHQHIHPAPDNHALYGAYKVSIALNLAFVILEVVIGLTHHSLGLVSDAGHKLIDVFSLLIALVGFHLALRQNGDFRRISAGIALVNALILLVAVGVIVRESILKISDPAPVDGTAISWTAGVGILVSGLSAWLLMRHQKNDINTRGAFLHMASDTLVSVGVVVSGIVISLTGWTFIDPVIGIVVALVILVSTWQLLAESIRMSMDAVPEGIHPEEIRQQMEAAEGVCSVHHLHIWPISTTETALTAHLVVARESDPEAIVHDVKHALHKAGIHHATLETEQEGHPCADESPCN